MLVSSADHGAAYWGFPYEPDTYSYVRAALRAGYVMLNFDRMEWRLSKGIVGIGLKAYCNGRSKGHRKGPESEHAV